GGAPGGAGVGRRLARGARRCRRGAPHGPDGRPRPSRRGTRGGLRTRRNTLLHRVEPTGGRGRTTYSPYPSRYRRSRRRRASRGRAARRPPTERRGGVPLLVPRRSRVHPERSRSLRPARAPEALVRVRGERERYLRRRFRRTPPRVAGPEAAARDVRCRDAARRGRGAWLPPAAGVAPPGLHAERRRLAPAV